LKISNSSLKSRDAERRPGTRENDINDLVDAAW
jgi:hypothetical protein